MKKIIQYVKDSYNELVHKVSWPTRAELTSSAVIVMIASIIMAVVVFAIDSSFEWALKYIYNLV